MTQAQSNPLAKHFRQPAIQLRLPSNGDYWPEGSLDMPPNNELPVYPMTVKDEVIIKTPDSLMNGDSVVSVISSCVPNIKDPWQLPSIDLDSVLISIRIASYGNEMGITTECPHCQNKEDYQIDLHNVLSTITPPDYSNVFEVDGLKFKLKPQPYYGVNKVNMVRFEEQKMLQNLSDSDISTEIRLEAFRTSMRGLIDLNLEVLTDSTEYIQTEDNKIVTDAAYIKQFYENCPSHITKHLQDTLRDLSKDKGIAPVTINCGNCSNEFSTSLTFDYSNFFD